MKKLIEKILHHRFGLVALLVMVLLSISLLTRITLMIKSAAGVDFSALNLLGIFFIGLFFDCINAGYFMIPIVLYLWLVPDRFFNKRWHHGILYGVFYFFTFMLLFNAISEWFFWDEFNTRFNFIAVDYLVYTNEVLGNIQQSYPIEAIIVVLVLFNAALVWLLRPAIRTAAAHTIRFGRRSLWAGGLLLIPVLSFFLVSNKLRQFSNNAYVNELSGNGMYELFAAYLNNELNYDQFYQRIEPTDAFAQVREMIQTPESEFVSDDPASIERKITNAGDEKRWNVVLISIESFSADFMATFGNEKNITPQLDSLVQHSLVFTNLYATGTRTVRGLEALSLCVPPTPGQSIVRRPGNEDLFSLGQVFNSKGYESKYIYGGYGYFDNMNYFFANNGYTVVDRTALKDEEIDYENVWGVADENLFTLAMRQIDHTVDSGKPAFAHIMTVSNHRPYTYPDGRIDIPSHTSREGAVKYTDYAIGKFLREARQKPWFDNTIFVIVADHCASSAGKTDLPINKYHIPMLIYSPAHVTPGKMERLMSQIDMGPTLLGMLNFSYTSRFYGYDMAKLEPGRERIFISTYQLLGYVRHDTLLVLEPQQRVKAFLPNYADGGVTPVPVNSGIRKQAISWYQGASHAFRSGLMKLQPR